MSYFKKLNAQRAYWHSLSTALANKYPSHVSINIVIIFARTVCPDEHATSAGASFVVFARGHAGSAVTSCRRQAAGNQLQTAEQRSTAVDGAGGGAEERPSRSLLFT